MPAVITHHIFGEDASGALPEGIVADEEELLAFLLGNQGPDPFFARFSTLPERASTCHTLAHRMQTELPGRAFLVLRDSVSRLPPGDERIGRAFVLGLLGHYALDRTAHPFVIWQERALAAAEGSLAGQEREVHAIIESDIDSWILWEKRHATVEDHPAAQNLMRTERIERVGGALFSQVALSVLGIDLGAGEYAGAVRDYERILRLVDPAGSMRTRALGDVERILREASMAESLAHYVTRSDECPSANLERHEWENPFTGQRSHNSFADLFDEAQCLYPRLAEALVRGETSTFHALVGGLNYEGCPVRDA